ncbi:MAG TPA: TrkA family potassium uptake protein [Anaerolineales bacterium]|nr:TrkA family potassium uptake protein [Anaerolineales bacterium]
MNFIVVGCGRLGSDLARRLFEQRHEVSVVDQRGEAFENLGPEFRGRTIEGEVLDQHVLRRAGIEDADGLAAVTNSDSVNAVVAHAARTIFKVPQVIARNYDPGRRPLFEAFGLQVVSSTEWGAQRIEELLIHGEMRMVFSAGNGEVEVYEVAIPAGWWGRRLKELAGEEALIIALTRAGRAQLPDGDEPLEQGDVIHISATMRGIQGIRSRLAGQES